MARAQQKRLAVVAAAAMILSDLTEAVKAAFLHMHRQVVTMEVMAATRTSVHSGEGTTVRGQILAS